MSDVDRGAMDIRLLGPVEVWRDGARLGLGPRKQRFCLALLAMEVNRVVSVDRLVDLTWPAHPPRTARHAIAVNISRLRAVLRPGQVELAGHGDGYALHADPHCVDVHRFRVLVTQALECAVQADRLGPLRRALAMWRGAALTGAGPPEVVERLTHRLAQERLAAEEERVDAELHTGNHLGVLGTLVELVAQHPYRQRLVGQLMLAQYRAGLIADALATYRAARAAMAGGTGLDPGRGLRELEHAILRGDPRLDLYSTT
ncbi:AfsR/SARP family transcriptional regulator [Phytohabitans sp. LJ34]|uniref:AfsR/SARP family transcriptional regulator n=1 Tax=Phytohabitans sp. LJ34 TaxID=3452217 RepID=UPI003F88FA7F